MTLGPVRIGEPADPGKRVTAGAGQVPKEAAPAQLALLAGRTTPTPIRASGDGASLADRLLKAERRLWRSPLPDTERRPGPARRPSPQSTAVNTVEDGARTEGLSGSELGMKVPSGALNPLAVVPV